MECNPTTSSVCLNVPRLDSWEPIIELRNEDGIPHRSPFRVLNKRAEEKRPAGGKEAPDMENQNNEDLEIDLLEFAQRGAEIPHAKAYRVRIDGEEVKVGLTPVRAAKRF